MFGTDNPFFPPLGVDDVSAVEWPSTKKVHATIKALPTASQMKKINSSNAEKLLNI